jgi:hypothetical protein
MNFSSEDFPALGEKVLKKSKPVPQEVNDTVETFVNSREVVVNTKRCLLCQRDVGKEHFTGEAWFESRFIIGECLCKNCIKANPKQYILHKYLEKDEVISERQKTLVCNWITIFPEVWPHQWEEEHLKKDKLVDLKWESFKHYTVWLRESRYVGEKVAWYSGNHRVILKGIIKKVNDDETYVVERDAHTEDEKGMSTRFKKTITKKRLLPSLSQKDSVRLILDTPGLCRPIGKHPQLCHGPCKRYRLGIGKKVNMKGGLWYCDECVKKEQIEEKDLTLLRALREKSDREHRGFGRTWVIDSWDYKGEPVTKFRTCSCSSCHYNNATGHMSSKMINYKCECCGNMSTDGWFDRTKMKEDHWECKRCWRDKYWKPEVKLDTWDDVLG